LKTPAFINHLLNDWNRKSDSREHHCLNEEMRQLLVCPNMETL
jgi:hypothetical protein